MVTGGLVVVGSVNLDHVVQADAFPRPGETITGRAVRSSIGGKGGNQAVAAARAGAPVTLLARVGTDGDDAVAALTAAGVDTSVVATTSTVPTGTAWITVAAGENTIVVVPGANHAWPEDWPDPQAAGLLASAAVVLAQREVPLPVVAAAAAACRGRFVLNAAPAAPLPHTLLARCDVLVVNEHEQLAVGGSTDVGVAHRALLARGVGAVVTTLGARGAVVTDASGSVALPAPAVDLVDSTGAGDAFTGVLCARLAAGDELADAARWAVTAGALAVQAWGTHEAYPDAGALRALLAKSTRS